MEPVDKQILPPIIHSGLFRAKHWVEKYPEEALKLGKRSEYDNNMDGYYFFPEEPPVNTKYEEPLIEKGSTRRCCGNENRKSENTRK